MKKFFLGALALAALPTAGHAALNVQVPTNATLIYKGLQWAWASPLDQNSVDLSYQSQFGWRLPTAAELAFAPTGVMFIYAGANTPFGGNDPATGATWQYTNGQTGAAANAVRYFSNFSHLDFCNAPGSGCGFNNEPAWNVGAGYAESLVVRAAPGGVPEPAAWAMMLAGFGLVGSAMRRRQKVAVTFA